MRTGGGPGFNGRIRFMSKRISLRSRIFLILGTLVLTTTAGTSVMMWYGYQMNSLFEEIIDVNLSALQAAEAMENALVNQKGFVSYYLLDGSPVWLKRLERCRQIFNERLGKARQLACTAADTEAIRKIASKYARYTKDKDRVVSLYRAGKREAGARLHSAVRAQFFSILELCDQYKEIHNKRVELARSECRTRARRLELIAGTIILFSVFLGALLGVVVLTQILNPLRRLAAGTDTAKSAAESRDEVKAVSRRVHSLIDDMDQTKSRLERSEEHLQQSEKLALVGELAAGMAHNIRNPLTSVKMRLFSMERSLDLSPTEKEDFDVISEEIRHIDSIVQNFLDFSRPYRLKMQKVSPSDTVDMALELLRYRIKSFGVDVTVRRHRRLPEIMADPERLKEVLANLLLNACEAMEQGGHIVISEQEGIVKPLGRVVVIKVKDDGPGIAEAIQGRLFEPFFTTKEEGTGLGLSIAARIVEQHGGWLNVSSHEGEGATFTITLPWKEELSWARS